MSLSHAVRALRRRLPCAPRTVVVLGSGLGGADFGPEDARIPYAKIPGFPATSVPGHPGALSAVGSTALLRGRAHYYEGRSMEEVVLPVRALAALGARTLVLTNAAGGLHPALTPGSLLLLRDHINLMGANPLRGGPHFADLSAVYDPALRKRVLAEARRLGLRIREGVYAAVAGPSYETPAEARMLRKLGADAVGMSTVPEAVAGRAAGLRVAAISLITNRAGSDGSHAQVLAAAAGARDRLARLLRALLASCREEPGVHRPS